MYVIRDWNKNFENNKSRILRRLDWVPFPNKMDGAGYTRLLDHAGGPAHYGVWCAVVLIASRCDIRGTLLKDGEPLTAEDIARIARMPLGTVQFALQRLVGEVRWMDEVEPPQNQQHGTKCQNPAPQCQNPAHEGKGMEGNRTEEEHPLPPQGGGAQNSASLRAEIATSENRQRADDLFRTFIGIFLAAGKALNDRDIERALRGWLNMEEPEQLICIDHIKQACLDGEYSDARHTPYPHNYLRDKPWTRRGLGGRILPTTNKASTKHQAAADLFTGGA